MNLKVTSEAYYNVLQESRYAIEKAFISRCFQTDMEKHYDNVKLRLHVIDSLYSTQMSKRHYGLEELATALSQYSDEKLIFEAHQYLNNEASEILDSIFRGKYGYNSVGKKEKKAVSLISKYLYFLTNYQFPIYDSLVKTAYQLAVKEFKDKVIHHKITDSNFVQALSQLNQLSKINNFEKLDNYLWYSQKLKLESYSLISPKEEHLKKLRENVPRITKPSL